MSETRDQDDNQKNDNLESDHPESDYNYSMCRLLKVNIDDFYENIHIPFLYFKDGEWDIKNIIEDNRDVLFYNEAYMSEEDKILFNKIFDRYSSQINSIMNPNSQLYEYLYKWTDFNKNIWKKKSNNNSLLYTTINKFKNISPMYILKLYTKIVTKQTKLDRDNIKKIMYKNLEPIDKNICTEIKKFKRLYRETVDRFVYLHPSEYEYDSVYAKGFINTLILEILDLADILIDNHVYAIHAIVAEIIDEYTPLDIINAYEISKHNGRNIYIV